MRSLGIGFAVALIGGCSVLNSFDEVAPALTEKEAGTSGSGGDNSGGASETGGSESTGGAESGGGSSAGGGGQGGADASVGGTPSTGGGGAAGAGGGGQGGNEGGADVFNPDQPIGVLVAYTGTDLVVVNMATARIVSTESFGSVRGILNDGLTNRWYIFEQGATPSDPATLHVRELNPGTGTWRELGTKGGLPQPRGRSGLLNRRLAYISDNGGLEGLTVLDIADPADVKVMLPAVRPLPAAAANSTTLVTSLTSTSATQPGGLVNVYYVSPTAACSPAGDGGTSCNVTARRYTVDALTVTESVTRTVGAISGNGGFAVLSDPGVGSPSDILALPAESGQIPDCPAPGTVTTTGSVSRLSPVNFSENSAPVEFPFASERVAGLAFDTCTNTAFVSSSIYYRGVVAVPLDPGGTPDRECSLAGGAVLFEPYTRTLLRTRAGAIEAYRVEGTRLAPDLVATGSALPPAFSATVLGVRAAPPCN